MQGKFWMVWREGGNIPRCQHDTKQGAQVEARRLASVIPGSKFFVLESVGVACKVDVFWRDINDTDKGSELPF